MVDNILFYVKMIVYVKAEKKKVVFTERTERSEIWCEQTAGKKYEVRFGAG